MSIEYYFTHESSDVIIYNVVYDGMKFKVTIIISSTNISYIYLVESNNILYTVTDKKLKQKLTKLVLEYHILRKICQ